MKFFNWVHKRFHHPIPKDHDDFGDVNINKVEKSQAATIEKELARANDTQALLKKAVLVDALDGWKDGILAIGTFGFDPLKPLIGNNPGEYLVLESEEDDETPDFSSDDDDNSNDYNDVVDNDDDNSKDGEANPLMFTALGHSFKDVVYGDDECLSADDKKNVGRTTLADLFLADADQADLKKKKKAVNMGKLGSAKVLSGYDDDNDDDDNGDDDVKYSKEQNRLRAKKGFSFAKKLIPKVKDEASPIKNIQRLMRRMLKRKIHPELLDVKSQKSDGQMDAGAIELVASATAEKSASESVSLLAMQGVPSEV